MKKLVVVVAFIAGMFLGFNIGSVSTAKADFLEPVPTVFPISDAPDVFVMDDISDFDSSDNQDDPNLESWKVFGFGDVFVGDLIYVVLNDYVVKLDPGVDCRNAVISGFVSGKNGNPDKLFFACIDG